MSNRPKLVHSDPNILRGTPVFVGTRVPLQNLFDYLEAGDTIDNFLKSFPSVSLDQAIAALEIAREALEAMRLPELVGSPLSVNALREDLQVSHKTVAAWIAVLERLYAVFRLAPFGASRIRAVKKEQKHYQLDWSLVPEDPARFENLIASHLLKWVHFQQDVEGRDVDLRYFRDTDGREVDFVVVERRQPILLVEAKWGDQDVDRGLRYLRGKFPSVPAWQLSAAGRKDHVTPDGIRVAPALTLLAQLI